MTNYISKSFNDFIDDAAKLIKEYLLKCPEDAMQTYGIDVPKNLSKMSSAEFLDFILGIQNSSFIPLFLRALYSRSLKL